MTMIDKLELALAKNGWTQTAFEAAARLSKNRISKWKGGKGKPTAEQAVRMATLLGLPVAYLIDDSIEEPPTLSASDRERQVWEIVREIGPEMAWRLLIRRETASNAPEPKPPEPRIVPRPDPAPRPKLRDGGKGTNSA